MDTISGIPAAAIEFYAALENNNNRQWWLENKDKYDADVLAPLRSLLRTLEPRFGPARIFRPYRDMRFSPASQPFKSTAGAFLSHYEEVGYYLHLDAQGLSLSGGYRSASPAQLSRYRAAVDATSSGTALMGVVAELQEAGFVIGGQILQTLPRGFPRDHPRPQLLRHKTLNATIDLGRPDWLGTTSATHHVTERWEQLRPLVEWVIRHAAP